MSVFNLGCSFSTSWDSDLRIESESGLLGFQENIIWRHSLGQISHCGDHYDIAAILSEIVYLFFLINEILFDSIILILFRSHV